MGNATKVIYLSQQALEQMSDSAPDKETLIHRGAAKIWLGVNYWRLGDLDRASEIYPEALSLNQKAGNIYAALASLQQLGNLAVIQGRLHKAQNFYVRALELARTYSEQRSGGRISIPAAAGPHLNLGYVLYQWNDLAGAAPHIKRAVELRELGETWEVLMCYKMLAYLRQAKGDYQAAYDLLGKALALGENLNRYQLNVIAEPGMEKLRIMLGRSRPEMAHLLTDVARDVESGKLRPDDDVDFARPENYVHEFAYSELARALIRLERADEALPLLERMLEAARSMRRQGDEIRYLVLQSLAFQAQGDQPTALVALTQALKLAQPEGYVRLFADEGEPMARLLTLAVSQGIMADYASELFDAFPMEIRQAFEPGGPLPSSPQPLTDPLTERELEVLRLMAAGLRFKEVAEHLVVSLNTVRTHAKHIYEKPNVHRRSQATTKANELKIL
jgi:LuxR family maltose regulon positive regulatory protein